MEEYDLAEMMWVCHQCACLLPSAAWYPDAEPICDRCYFLVTRRSGPPVRVKVNWVREGF